MERWAKSVNAAKTQTDDNKKGTAAAAATKTEETKSASEEVFKVVRWQIYRKKFLPPPTIILSVCTHPPTFQYIWIDQLLTHRQKRDKT